MIIQALVGELKRFFDRADYHDTVLWFERDG